MTPLAAVRRATIDNQAGAACLTSSSPPFWLLWRGAFGVEEHGV